MARAHPYPSSLADIKFCTARMHKVELSKWVLLMQIAISLQGSAPIRARVNHGEAVEVALLVRCGMGFQGRNDESLIGISLAYLSPEHGVSFSAASLRLWEHGQRIGKLECLSYTTHLSQRRLGLGQPESHPHGPVQRDGCGQFSTGLLTPIEPSYTACPGQGGSGPGAGACPALRPG